MATSSHSARAGAPRPPAVFLPRLTVGDAVAGYWLRQVTLRLRREICWLWRERGLLAGAGAGGVGPNGAAAAHGPLLPPFADRLAAVLDLARYDDQRRAFFASDETAAYLTALLDEPPPAGRGAPPPPRGGLGWAARELALAPVDCFGLALALTPAVDGSAGTVLAACLNEPQRTQPTLALAQRLWDAPEAVLPLADPSHPLRRTGLLEPGDGWDAPLAVPGLVARQLLFPGHDAPAALAPLPPPASEVDDAALELAVARLRAAPADRAQLLPIVGAPGAPLADAAARVAAALGRAGAQPAPGARPADAATLATVAWLRGLVLYLPLELLAGDARDGHDAPVVAPLPALPATILVGVADRAALARLPDAQTLPPLPVRALDYRGRLAAWRALLPAAARDAAVADAVADCARRFRYEGPAIARIARTLGALGRPPAPADLYAACRADVELGELAQPVAPRFALADLMLPAKQTRQVDEIVRAVRALTAVHHEWGTARAWNESGLSALFAGPPGTGKTMAAEVIAGAVGMPLFRIDLSQVVNKYIGETEKNLRRLFDAADAADVILFFDEADALFGKRTEVKDAHDRYANLEISYLLERMERFRGLAILATNRRKDLDEAFLRRLRFLVEFPLPGAEERLRIWRAVVPPEVDAAALDLAFLADRFPLAGGHIRAIVFQACLQSAGARAGGGAPRRLEMPAVMTAVRRELEKLGRTISLDQFGPYAALADDGAAPTP